MEEAANSEQSVPPCDGTMPRSASELGRDSAGMQIAGPVKRGLWEPVSLLCSQPVPADASFPKKWAGEDSFPKAIYPHPHKHPPQQIILVFDKKVYLPCQVAEEIRKENEQCYLKKKKKMLNIKPKTHDLDGLKTVALNK